MPRFYLDNDVSLGLVPLLKERGHTLETARGLGHSAAGDDAQLLIAVQRQATLVTYNRRDFELLHDAWRTWPTAFSLDFPPHSGILTLAHAPVAEQMTAIDELLNVETFGRLRNELFSWRHGRGWQRRIVG